MSKHLTLIVTTSLCTIFILSHWYISQRLIQPKAKRPIATPKVIVHAPDFAAIDSIKLRKKRFFNYFTPLVEKNNRELLALRENIEKDTFSEQQLRDLGKKYRIKSEDLTEIKRRLLIKVDTVPIALVLAQAAIESAWGTSRFAIEGNNYFGQWCFRQGCGLVPQERQDGKAHEVRVFESPQASVNSYMRNINSHPAYRELRKARQTMRQQQSTYSGCRLAQELESYSEKGQAYVGILKQIIRANKLEADPKGYCRKQKPAPKPKSEPTPKAATENKPKPAPQLEAEPKPNPEKPAPEAAATTKPAEAEKVSSPNQ